MRGRRRRRSGRRGGRASLLRRDGRHRARQGSRDSGGRAQAGRPAGGADVETMAGLLPEGAPLGLRGSSMGGYLALVAAAQLDAAAVVAICPASADHLAQGLRDQRLRVPGRPRRR